MYTCQKKIVIVSRPLRSDCFTIEHLKLTCDKNKKDLKVAKMAQKMFAKSLDTVCSCES